MKYIAATDGSTLKGEKFGWAWVLADESGRVIATKFGCELIDPSWAHAWNVAAECTAVIDLLRSLKPEVEVEIIHDYEGLGSWGRGQWKAKSPCSIGYCSELKRLARNVSFTWVKGHEGNTLNELVDGLAYKALTDQPEEAIFEKRGLR